MRSLSRVEGALSKKHLQHLDSYKLPKIHIMVAHTLPETLLLGSFSLPLRHENR